MKKTIALILSAVLLLGLLAGCGSEPAKKTDPVINEEIPVGMFILSAGASVSISYNAEGTVMEIGGANELGDDLAEAYTEFDGKSCATVAKELIDAAAKSAYLNADVKNIIIKQSIRSELPGSNFLETIEAEVKAAAEAAGSKAEITLIDESMLDENGYINFETAKALLCVELGVEKLDQYYGSDTPNDGVYICTAEVAGVQTFHHIDAVTGLIQEATEEELLGDPTEETVPEETHVEEPVEEVVEEDVDVPLETVGPETEEPEETESEATEATEATVAD